MIAFTYNDLKAIILFPLIMRLAKVLVIIIAFTNHLCCD
jgi:hypothetical protein